jgi:hypothetical protein
VTAQTPAAVNATGNPDHAVATTVKSLSPNVFASKAPKLIDWSAL